MQNQLTNKQEKQSINTVAVISGEMMNAGVEARRDRTSVERQI